MEIIKNEVQQKRLELLSMSFSSESDFCTALNQDAQDLHTVILDLDKNITEGLIRLNVSASSVIPHIDIKSWKEIGQIYQSEQDDSTKKELSKCLDEIAKDYTQHVTNLKKMLLSLLKEVHRNRYTIVQSNLSSNIDASLKKKEDEMSKHLIYIKDTLQPLLESFAVELAVVDSSLKEKLYSNSFSKMIELLPKSDVVSSFDAKQPEISAAKLGYEASLTIIKGLAEMQDMCDYFDRHIALKEQKEEMERVLNEEYENYSALETQLAKIKQLKGIIPISDFYVEYTNDIEDKLNDFHSRITPENTEAIDVKTALLELKQYIDTFAIIWA